MSKFILSGFGDEIDQNLSVQIKVLKDLKIKHIEMRGVNGKNLCDCSLEEAIEIKRVLDADGFSLSAIGSPIGKIKITDEFQPHLENFKHVLKIAEIMQVKYIRIFSFFMPDNCDYSIYRDEVISRMQQLISIASDKNIILLHENEKDIYGDTAQRCLDLLKTLNSPSFRATFDPANFVQCNVEVFPSAYELLKPYIEYIHIKDATYEDGKVTPAGQGDGKVSKVIEALIKDNFSGYLSLEPHLCDFVGFSNLEASNAEKAPATQGILLFKKATKALKTILNELGVKDYE
jgi:sugar phosphate isomerase/epimerase